MNNAETMKHARAALGKTAAEVAVDVAVERLGNALVGHTPGPWKAVTESGRGRVVKDGRNVCIAEVNVWDSPKENARLIAAAPDLLAACRAMIEKWETLSDESANLMVRADLDNLARGALALRAAIARAEGGGK